MSEAVTRSIVHTLFDQRPESRNTDRIDRRERLAHRGYEQHELTLPWLSPLGAAA